MKNLDLLIPERPPETDRYVWATVTSTSPLAIRFDGEATPLGIVPNSLVKRLAIGNRVWCQVHGRRVVILGVAGGEPDSTPEPQPEGWETIGKMRALKRTSNLTIPNGVWTTIPWQTERADSQGTASAITTPGGQILPSYAGIYQVTASVEFNQHVTGRRLLQVITASGLVLAYAELPVNAGYSSGTASAAGNVQALDEIRVQVYQSSGTALPVTSSDRTSVSVFRIS